MNKELKFYVDRDYVMGSFAKYALQQSPYPVPDNFEIVLTKLNDFLIDFFMPQGYLKMTYKHMKSSFLQQLKSIPECVKWNNRKNGREGVGGGMSLVMKR